MIVCLKGGSHADAVFLAKETDGREFVTDLEGLVANELFETFGYLKIEGVFPGEFCFFHNRGMKSDTVKINKSASVLNAVFFRILPLNTDYMQTATLPYIPVRRAYETRFYDVDWDNLELGKHTTDHMFVCDFADGKWQQPEIIPY